MLLLRQWAIRWGLAGAVLSCGAAAGLAAPPANTTASVYLTENVTNTFPRVLTDGAGRSVTLPERPQRIISLSPALTDLVLAEGGVDELVGVTRYCIVPDRVPPIARVGGLDPDYEQILALRPDVVLVANLADGQMVARLQSLGLRVVVFSPEGLDNLPRDFRLLGRVTGRDAAGEALAGEFEKLRALVRARLAAVPPSARPTAAMLYGPDLLAPGPGGFAGQLLEAAGARNVVPAGATAWTQLAPEALLKLNPARLFLVHDPAAAPWSLAGQPALRDLAAVRAGKVTDLPAASFERPGPTLGEALWQLARALYPERFPEATARAALDQAAPSAPDTAQTPQAPTKH